MRSALVYFSIFFILASIFVIGLTFFKTDKIPTVATNQFFQPTFFEDRDEDKMQEKMNTAYKEIQIEIDGEKHSAVISLDVFSFPDALANCDSKGLKMPDKFSQITTISGVYGTGGKNAF